MANTNNQSTSHAKLIGVFVLGIMIPLLAAVMPWLMDRIFPQNSLTYTFQGPISAEKFIALELFIENNGTKAEQNIEAFIPAKIIKTADYEVAKNGTIKTVEKMPDIVMESNSPTAKLSHDENNIIIKIDSLKPEEKASVKLFIYGGRALIFESELKNSRITSQDVLAKYGAPSEIELYIYKAGTWLFILFILFVILYGFYYEKLMPREAKEKYLLQQIDKLK